MPKMQGFRRRARCIIFAAAALAILLFPLVGGAAAPTDAQRCQANKLRAAGAEVRARLACEKEDLDTGATAACATAARERRADAFARFEERGGCDTIDDSDEAGEEIDAVIAVALAELRPGGPAASDCTAAQLAILGRASRKLSAAYAHDKRHPDPERLASRLASFQGKFERAFARAAEHGDCLSTAGSGVGWAIVAQAATRLRDLLCPICPCWTTESLEATFPPGFFDEDGRGGAVCQSDEAIGVGSASTCFLPEPHGPGYHLPRSAAVVVGSSICLLYGDLDPGGTGSCGVPSIGSVTAEQATMCVNELLASRVIEECL